MTRKAEIALVATLTICSAFYVAVTMLYYQIHLAEGLTKLNNEVVFRDYVMNWVGLISLGCYSILVLNMIQCALIYHQNFWTFCLTLFFKIGCIAHNICFAVMTALTYSECDWQLLTIKTGPDFYFTTTVCVVSGCSPGDYCYWLENTKLLNPIVILFGIAAFLELVFLVLYCKHSFKNVTRPNCCQLYPIDSVTNPHSIVVVGNNEQLSQGHTDSNQPVNETDQSIINVNFEQDTPSEE